MPRQPLRVFVATGNSPAFPRLLDEVARLVDTRSAEFEFFVQAGFSRAEFPDLPGCDFVSREEFARRLSWADRVVCHAGAGTIFEAFLAGHTPLVVPRLRRHGEHINDHQLELARAVDRRAHAILCADIAGLAEALVRAPARGATRDAQAGRLVRAVDAALLAAAPSRRRTGLLGVIATLWRRSRGGKSVSAGPE